MRQVNLLNLSEEEKKMTAIEFIRHLDLKRKESVVGFVKSIEGKDVLYKIGESYYAFHIKSVDLESNIPSFCGDSIMLGERSIATLDNSTFYVDKLSPCLLLKSGAYEKKYKAFFEAIKNKLLNVIYENESFNNAKEVELSEVYKPNTDKLLIHEYELNFDDKFKDLTMNDIFLKAKEKMGKDVEEYNRMVDILKSVMDKVLISKDSFEYTFFVPLTVDYTCSLVEGIWFSIAKDLSRIFFEERELFDDSQTRKKFYIIENDEENDRLMSDLLKFKNRYHKLLNSIKVSLKKEEE